MTRKEEREQFAKEQVKGAEKLYGYKYSIEDVECACLSGAEWADKTMLDKVCKWLEENTPNYINYFIEHDFPVFIDDFKKAMKGE